MLSLYPWTNTVFVTYSLLKKLKVKTTKLGVSEMLENHPEYPSLLSVSDCLTQWKVPHHIFKLNYEDYNSSDLKLPFIAHTNIGEGSFIIVHTINNGEIVYSDENIKNALISESKFLRISTGIFLHAESDENSTEPGYKANLSKQIFNAIKLPIYFLVMLLGLLTAINIDKITLGFCLLIGFNQLGAFISYLLLINSFDSNNPLVHNLCKLGNKSNCNAVLQSHAARVTAWLSWSEVGFLYFTGSLLSLLLVPSSLQFLFWLNLLALPFTFYSISYQYRNKTWCTLCCTVQLLLWIIFTIQMSSNVGAINHNDVLFTWQDYISMMFSFALPGAILLFIKPLMQKSALLKPTLKQLRRFKYNDELFRQLLTNQTPFPLSEDVRPLVLGDIDAKMTITIVSNPFCQPCAKAHQTIIDWLNNGHQLQIKMIFITTDRSGENVCKHLTALASLNDVGLAEKALNEWYAQSHKNFQVWSNKYPVNFGETDRRVMEKQKIWCEKAKITHTPTILINGYKLSEPYLLEDLEYFL